MADACMLGALASRGTIEPSGITGGSAGAGYKQVAGTPSLHNLGVKKTFWRPWNNVAQN